MGGALGGISGGAGAGKGGAAEDGPPLGEGRDKYRARLAEMSSAPDMGRENGPINRVEDDKRGDIKSLLGMYGDVSDDPDKPDEEDFPQIGDEEEKSWRDKYFPVPEGGGSRDPLKHKLDSFFGGEAGRFSDGIFEEDTLFGRKSKGKS